MPPKLDSLFSGRGGGGRQTIQQIYSMLVLSNLIGRLLNSLNQSE